MSGPRPSRTALRVGVGLSSAALLIGAACGTREAASPSVGTPGAAAPTVEDARAFYRSQEPYLSPVVLGDAVPAGLPDLRAATCGACHRAIYDEWKVSTHARAWLDDLQFQAELHKPREGGGDVGWMCVNCHTPVEAQLPRLVVGVEGGRLDRPIYVDNPGFDAALQLEAITCATCHVRDGLVLGPYGDTKAPHATSKSDHLLTEEVCTRCHQADAVFPELTLACAFTTGEEFAASPAAAQGERCQSCHMPEVERPLMAGLPPRPTRRHWFGGSMIPKKPEYEAEIAPLRAVFPDGLELAWGPLPDAVSAGAEVQVELTMRNEHAGHRLPTGDPERHLIVELVATASDGAILGQASHRVGTVYQWHPEVKKLSDNRLGPGEERALTLTFTAPSSGSVRLDGRATKWRISPENLEYHDLVGKVPASREFWSESRTLPAR